MNLQRLSSVGDTTIPLGTMSTQEDCPTSAAPPPPEVISRGRDAGGHAEFAWLQFSLLSHPPSWTDSPWSLSPASQSPRTCPATPAAPGTSGQATRSSFPSGSIWFGRHEIESEGKLLLVA